MSAEPESEDACLLRKAVREYLLWADRGVATDMATDTVLTKAEISQFMNGMRPLTDGKIISAINWLVKEGRMAFVNAKGSR